MMTIARAINDVVLVVLKTPEILEPIGISQEKFFAKVLGYDETGLWVQFPDFELPTRVGDDSGIWVPESMRFLSGIRKSGWQTLYMFAWYPQVCVEEPTYVHGMHKSG